MGLEPLLSDIDKHGTAFAALVAALAAGLAFLAPVLAALLNAQSIKSDTLRKIRSDKRQAWIDGFRIDLSELLAVGPGYHIHPHLKDRADQQQRFEELRARLRLRLNPNEIEHQRFDVKMRLFVDAVIANQDIADAGQALVETAQPLLKKEWDKVKQGL